MIPGSVVPVHFTSQCKVRALILLQLIPVVAHPYTSITVLLARVSVLSPDSMMMAASAGLSAAGKICHSNVCVLQDLLDIHHSAVPPPTSALPAETASWTSPARLTARQHNNISRWSVCGVCVVHRGN